MTSDIDIRLAGLSSLKVKLAHRSYIRLAGLSSLKVKLAHRSKFTSQEGW